MATFRFVFPCSLLILVFSAISGADPAHGDPNAAPAVTAPPPGAANAGKTGPEVENKTTTVGVVAQPEAVKENNNATEASFSKTIYNGIKELYGLASGSNTTSQDNSNGVLGATCKIESDCATVSNSTCDKGMCNCNEDYVFASKKDRCLRIVHLGEECEEDVQCSKADPGALCSAYICRCSDKYTAKDGKCEPNTKLGSVCKGNSNCSQIPFSECIDGFCSCPKPYIPSTYSNVCLSAASPASPAPCQEDIQCSETYGDNSRCIQGLCECDHGLHPDNGKCISDLQLGAACNRSLECTVSKQTEEEKLRECRNNTCVCIVGYSSTNVENHCLKGSDGYKLQASLSWLLCVLLLQYFIRL